MHYDDVKEKGNGKTFGMVTTEQLHEIMMVCYYWVSKDHGYKAEIRHANGARISNTMIQYLKYCTVVKAVFYTYLCNECIQN